MTLGHFRTALRSFTKQVPFRSFQVELVSGSRIAVEHPEALTIEKTRLGFVLIHRRPTGRYTVFEVAEVVCVIE